MLVAEILVVVEAASREGRGLPKYLAPLCFVALYSTVAKLLRVDHDNGECLYPAVAMSSTVTTLLGTDLLIVVPSVIVAIIPIP